MRTRKTIHCSYLLLLALSFLFVPAVQKSGILTPSKPDMPPFLSESENRPQTELPPEVPSTGEAEESTEEELPASDPVMEETEAAASQEPPALSDFFETDLSYFDDALFIGDSRTVGLSEYGDLGKATVLADTGMNIYKIFNDSFSTSGDEKQTLTDLLTQRQFGKIYLMLGINELGYDFSQTVKRYQEAVVYMEELQPNAIFFLEANLHITQKKSAQSDIFTNENIDRFNKEVERIAEERERCVFLDVNEIFDDENGCLSTEYTADAAHVLGKYYADWVDWILKHGVAFQAE